MTSRNTFRVPDALRRGMSIHATAEEPVIERSLRFIGADPGFTDDVLGDLAEERARRRAQNGDAAATLWYVTEVLRSAPHLMWNAAHHGGRNGRARVAIILAALALIGTAAFSALRPGSPAVRLELDGQWNVPASEGVVVNSRYPVRLEMRAFDENDQLLKSSDVRFRWMSGARVSVSWSGAVTCLQPGDAILRASLGMAATNVRVRCMPVETVQAPKSMQLVIGEKPRVLPFEALDADGAPVRRLAGELRVRDTTIARLERGRVRPLSPGQTEITVRIGDGEARTLVSVYELIRTLEGLTGDQRHVIAPVSLAPGRTITWPLPTGTFVLELQRLWPVGPIPTLAVDGAIVCTAEPARDANVQRMSCVTSDSGASVRITHPDRQGENIVGALTLDRRKTP